MSGPPDVHALDLSPISDTSADTEAWLSRLHSAVNPQGMLVHLSDRGQEPDLVVHRDVEGWHAGRYIGTIAFEGRHLTISPRLGRVVLEGWLAEATGLRAVPGSGSSLKSELFLPRLLGLVWANMFAIAGRHGAPALRRDHSASGRYVQGKLDVAATVKRMAQGRQEVVSVSRHRDLDNPIARALVCAEATLTRLIGDELWHSEQIAEVMPRLRGAVGARPALPTASELRSARLSPITMGYRKLAELSCQIARLQGLQGDRPGETWGILIDVAELWELFVLGCLRRAAGTLHVEHGTASARRDHLLRSLNPGSMNRGLGRLKPDFLVSDNTDVRLVADAKYKRLVGSRQCPSGVAREDLYQVTSYVTRFSRTGSLGGLLLYPRAPDQESLADAESHGPWQLPGGEIVRFERLSLEREEATLELRRLLSAAIGAAYPAATGTFEGVPAV